MEEKNRIHHGEEQQIAGEKELQDRSAKHTKIDINTQPTRSQPMQRSDKAPLQGQSNDVGNANGARY